MKRTPYLYQTTKHLFAANCCLLATPNKALVLFGLSMDTRGTLHDAALFDCHEDLRSDRFWHHGEPVGYSTVSDH